MKKISWPLLFVVAFTSDLAVVYSGNETMRYVTKPLLMPLLILFFVYETIVQKTILKKLVISALAFSWLGDMLLMFEEKNENFFIPGLIAFLIAHIFYILFFEKIILKETLKKSYWIFLPVMVYYVVLISVLAPTLGEMKWPVRIYGIILSYMLIKVFQAGGAQNRRAVLCLIAGTILFVISDSILALNKFYQPFQFAGFLIMATYGIAQLLITLGAIRYITNNSKQ